jgi:hypothetical protein
LTVDYPPSDVEGAFSMVHNCEALIPSKAGLQKDRGGELRACLFSEASGMPLSEVGCVRALRR